MAAPHITDDLLELLALGRLPESAAEPAEEHLLICAECRERLAGWDQYVAAMRAAASELNLAAATECGTACRTLNC